MLQTEGLIEKLFSFDSQSAGMQTRLKIMFFLPPPLSFCHLTVYGFIDFYSVTHSPEFLVQGIGQSQGLDPHKINAWKYA